MSGPAPLLLHVFPTFAVGGAQARFAVLANGFGPAYRHAIVAMDGDLSCGVRLSDDLDIAYPRIAMRKGDTMGNVRRFIAALRRLRPDVLVTSNWGSIEWAMANAFVRLPHLHMEDGFGPEERMAQLPRRVWARRMLLRRSVVMLPSRNLLRIATDIWRLDPGQLRYIPNGIDLAGFAAPARQGGWRAAGPVIGTVAALRAEKNVARLIRAFALARPATQARLVIVGDGPDRPALEALAAELAVADAVTFTGHLEAPQQSYAHFDLFALSSDTEQMPLSVLEAMAAALPVVSTDVGDVRGMVADENAAFIVPRDPEAMAAAMRALLADPALCHSIGTANRALAERRYAQETMIAAHLALIESLRARRGHSGSYRPAETPALGPTPPPSPPAMGGGKEGTESPSPCGRG